MSFNNDAVNTLVEYIYKIIDQRLEENNKKYVDFRFSNLKIDGSQLKENTIPGVAIKDGALSYLKVYDFVAQVASIALAEIGIANINLAKIVKADMETAIIREGVAGEVYIDDLVVASAKFVTAMFGELVIKGQDGLYYQLGVDSEGNVTAVEKTVTSGEIEDGRTTEGFTIIESSITAQNLNVSTIRGARAILMDLFVSTLTASDAYIAKLVTPLITSPLGAGLDISANPYLQLSVDNIQVGGRNLLLASELNDVTSWTLSSGVTIDSSVKYYGNKSAKIYATGLTEDANKTLSQNVDSIYWTPGKKYMLSAWQMCPAIASMDAPAYLGIAMNVGGTYQYVTEEITAVEFINNEWRRTTRSFTIPDGTTSVRVRFGLRRNGTVYFACPKLEVGDKATDWSPSPDDSVKALKSSSITIIDDSVDVDSTGTINLAAGSSVNISAGGKLNVSASDIVLSSEDTLISKFIQTSEQITLAVSGVRVGGVNLLRGTSGEYVDVSLGEYFTALTGRLELSALGLAAGDEITLSMSLKAPSVKAVSARITTYSAATGQAGKTVFAPGAEGIIPAGGAGRSVLTMTIPAGATHLEAVVANRTPENTATVTMQAGRVQLERGNKATDWSLSPLDTDERFIGAENRLTVAEEGINARATKTEVNALTERVETAESSLELKADSATLTSTKNDLQSQINLVPGQINLAVGGVQVGGTNHATGDTRTPIARNTWNGTENQVMNTPWRVVVDPGWKPGDAITISCHYTVSGVAWAGGRLRLRVQGSGDVTGWEPSLTVTPLEPDGGNFIYVSDADQTSGSGLNLSGRVTFSMTATAAWLSNNHFTVSARGDMVTAGTVTVWGFKAERGNKATDWSPHPEEFKAGSSISLTKDGARISAPSTVISVPKSASDETEVARFDKDGVFANEVFSPTVRGVYVGPSTIYVDPAATQAQVEAGTHYKSLTAALGALNHKTLAYNVEVNLKQSTAFYESVNVSGVSGYGRLRFRTTDSPTNKSLYATINGQIAVVGCGRVMFERLRVQASLTSGSFAFVSATDCNHLRLQNSIFSATTGVSTILHSDSGSLVYASSCEFYDTVATSSTYAFFAHIGSQIMLSMCSGNVGGALVLVTDVGGRIAAHGTVPYSTGALESQWNNGEIRATGVTMDAGSVPPAVPPTTTYTYAAVDTRTHASGGGWFGTGDRTIRQGYTPASKVLRGAMWFDLTALRANLSGKTPVSATISFLCLNNGIKAGQVLGLAGITNTAASGSIAGHKDYGALDAIAWGESMAMAIPTQAVIDLVAGTVNALCIYSGETAADLYDGRDYSKRYRRCEGYGTSGAPVLTVTTE